VGLDSARTWTPLRVGRLTGSNPTPYPARMRSSTRSSLSIWWAMCGVNPANDARSSGAVGSECIVARFSGTGEDAGGRVPGLYRALLDQEREIVATPDPRWTCVAKWSDLAVPPPDLPASWMQTSLYLDDLDAGRPVTVASWKLPRHVTDRRASGGASYFTVFPDDTVAPAQPSEDDIEPRKAP